MTRQGIKLYIVLLQFNLCTSEKSKYLKILVLVIMDSTIVDNFGFLMYGCLNKKMIDNYLSFGKRCKGFPGQFFGLFPFWVQFVIELSFKNWYLVEWHNFLIRRLFFMIIFWVLAYFTFRAVMGQFSWRPFSFCLFHFQILLNLAGHITHELCVLLAFLVYSFVEMSRLGFRRN